MMTDSVPYDPEDAQQPGDTGDGANYSDDEYNAHLSDEFDAEEEDDDDDDDVTQNGLSSSASSADEGDELESGNRAGRESPGEEVTSLADGFDMVPDHIAPSTGSKRVRLVSEIGDIHEILSYPADPRGVRFPDYDLKPMTRYSKFPSLYFGPKHVGTVFGMMRRWRKHAILPSGTPDGPSGCIDTPFVPAHLLSASRERLLQHRTRHSKDSGGQILVFLSKQSARPYIPQAPGRLEAILGHESNKRSVSFKAYEAKLISCSGLPIPKSRVDDTKPEALMCDVGGVVQDMAWAPRQGVSDQFLLLSVTPLREEAIWEGRGADEDLSTGCLQLWKIPGDGNKDSNRLQLPPTPILSLVIGADWGRFKRIQWCPVPIDSDGCLGRVAAQCGDGTVRIFEVPAESKEQKTQYAQMYKPLATLAIEGEKNIWATCTTWVSSNRICVGHVDGTLTLWSVQPATLLQRHLTHHSQLLDVRSAYPSHPMLVASIPLSGCIALTDLSRPTSETTTLPINSINFSPHILDWCDLLQSFIAPSPTMGTANTCIGIMTRRHFPTARCLISLPTIPTCLSVGTVHPFALVGDTSGSLWACSLLARLIFNKSEGAYKMRLLSHEHRPPATVSSGDEDNGGTISGVLRDPGKIAQNRGTVRILTGFLPESNVNPKMEILTELSEMKSETRSKWARSRNMTKGKSMGKKKGKETSEKDPLTSLFSRNVLKGRGRPRKVEAATKSKSGGAAVGLDMDDDTAAPGTPGDADEGGTPGSGPLENSPARDSTTDMGDDGGREFPEGVIHEPLSRITVVRWNPNQPFGHWAAVAMASGLVRIMDLGVEF